MPQGYGSHRDYMGWCKEKADARQEEVEEALKTAFAGFIEKREVEVIVFSGMSAF